MCYGAIIHAYIFNYNLLLLLLLLLLFRKILDQHTRKERNQGTTGNSHIGHCTDTSESTDVKVQ
jgi:hypothetical protein